MLSFRIKKIHSIPSRVPFLCNVGFPDQSVRIARLFILFSSHLSNIPLKSPSQIEALLHNVRQFIMPETIGNMTYAFAGYGELATRKSHIPQGVDEDLAGS